MTHSAMLPPGHRPIPGQFMELTYFFLDFPKLDRFAFHQVCNLWTMTKQVVTRWFNCCFEAQRADGSLKRLKSIQAALAEASSSHASATTTAERVAATAEC